MSLYFILIVTIIIPQFEFIHSPLSEKDIVTFRFNLVNRLDQCTLWRSKLDKKVSNTLDHFLMNSKFDEFREASTQLAADIYPESIDCLDSCSYDIEQFNDFVKSESLTTKNDLGDLLDNEQIYQLHMLLEKTKRPDIVEKGILQHLHGIPEKRRQELLSEFFASKPSRVRRSTMSRKIAREPTPLTPDMLSWQTPRHKNVLNKQKLTKGSQWDAMNTIGDQYYHLRKAVRVKYDGKFMKYCNESLLEIIGRDNFATLEEMVQDSEQVEHIWNKYHQIIGYLKNEEDQLTAEHYGQFCRKIYRLLPIEQADLMSWLRPAQRFRIAEMIQDREVNDSQVYEKLYEFFNQASGDAKDDADEVITLGCRKFIAHHLGDQVAEDIEDLRVAGGTGSSHHTAAMLLVKHNEIAEAGALAHQKRIEESVSICKRIYLDYDGSCFCNGRSTMCDEKTHVCQNCTGGTLGIQCEKCPEDLRLDKTGKCVPGLDPDCFCNSHSYECTDGICTDCENNTTGDHCELCDIGFYGDPTMGRGCTKCPCPKNGECSYNTVTNRIECNDCPKGHIGERCEDSESSYQPFTTEASTITLVDNQL
ncbi:Laminin EGF-like domain-containing protein [Caenorhabditis elegans]|uniref:Laminin EGF-like domain-containing protein n=1 Tax=Caenorhabditis elegans TaxID=6239 RepID=Q9TYU4_CAEEL|nr:Laminin EGF-like domain-containing protein [Caenorhabditis elegans]CCD70074.1 Laminin EGF-like domain-containing protein [Caenorhabditis elegans]|eukprot:NP_504797.1 Uncharacterized protein CELE_VC5.2 [Caenorhabditis elegans]